MSASNIDRPTARFTYVGCYTRRPPGGGGRVKPVGISVFAVDGATGDLSPVQTVPSENPSFLAFHPSGRFLYGVCDAACCQPALRSRTRHHSGVASTRLPYRRRRLRNRSDGHSTVAIRPNQAEDGHPDHCGHGYLELGCDQLHGGVVVAAQ